MSRLLVGLVIGFLVVCLVVCSVASYWGYGVRQVGERHLRTGSVHGPTVIGGGPGAGK